MCRSEAAGGLSWRRVLWGMTLLLALVGCGGRVDALAERLQDESAEVRQQAARELAEFGPEAAAAVPALSDATKDPDPAVRRTAAHALGRIGPKAKPGVDALKALLADDDVPLRLTAAYALVEIDPDDPAPVDVLLAAAASDDPRAIVALGQLGPTAERALPVLRRLARSPREVVRSMAAEAVTRIAGE